MIPLNPPYFTGGLLISVLTFKWTFSSSGRSNLINAKLQKEEPPLHAHTQEHAHAHSDVHLLVHLSPSWKETSRWPGPHKDKSLLTNSPQAACIWASSATNAAFIQQGCRQQEHTIQQLHRDMWRQTETSTQRYEQNAFRCSRGGINWDKNPAILH